MNENKDYNSGTVRPYKATSNLNTAIGNPSVNINDTMNVNIQNVATNTVVTSNIQNDQNNNLNISNDRVQTQQNQNSPGMVTYNIPQNNIPNNNINNNSHQPNNQQANYVTRRYVTTDNKSKKKTLKINLGPEFKIALLIVVILLVFVFLLPIISEIFLGY